MNFTERVDPLKVEWLLLNITTELIPVNEDKFNLTLIKKTLQHYDKCKGNNKVMYSKKDELNVLRDYGTLCIQNVPSNIRGFLCDSMTDIDMVNCHPTIIYQLCKKHNIECTELENYCLNRKQLVLEGKVDKMSVIKSINNYKPLKDCSYYMSKLDAEIKHIQSQLIKLEQYKPLLNMAIKSAETKKNKNISGIFMSNLATSFEVKFLHSCISLMQQKEIEIGVLIYDGFMVYGNYYNNPQLLEDLSQHIFQQFGFEISFSYKEHDTSIKLPDGWTFRAKSSFETNQQYVIYKKKYETDFGLAFIEKTTSYSYKIGGQYHFFSRDGIKQILATQRLDSFTFLPSNFFIQCWLSDPNRKTYENVGVFPHDKECPDGFLNLWTGFACERIQSTEIVDIEPIFKHIRILMGNNEECFNFMLKWLANLFQYPSSASLFVFMGSEEGAGKGSFMDLMSNMMGGDKYFLCEDMKEDLFGTFNGHLRDTVLVNIDEPEFKSTVGLYNKIKSMITRKTIAIHNKGEKKYDIPHVIKYIGTSNELHAFKISKNDRRFFLVESSNELIGNYSYFKWFNEYIQDEKVQYSFWKFLMDYPTKKQLDKSDIPMTKLREEAVILSRDSVEDFLEEFDGYRVGIEFYNAFKSFMTSSGIDCKMSKKSFEMKANRLFEKYNVNKKEIDRKSFKGVIYYTGDFDDEWIPESA